jgi:hypothetical protein
MEDDDAPSPEEEVPAEVIAAEGTALLCFSDAHPIFHARPSLTIQLGSCIANMQRKKTSPKYLHISMLHHLQTNTRRFF